METTITDAQASRFLAQASMGATREHIARVKALGYVGWLEEQFAMAPSTSRVDALVAHGYELIGSKNSQAGFDECAWRKLIASPDTLRQRITLALSEILVVSIEGLVGGWKQFSAAHYLDLLEAHAFGNYRALLEAVSRSTAMGEYLTYRGNAKANPKKGSLPDENYARELMQLFTIGLVQLNPDGSPVVIDGDVQESYTQDDICNMARVLTGWDYDLAGGTRDTPDYQLRPMLAVEARHDTQAKVVLGHPIPAGGSTLSDLQASLDILMAHPNIGPFIGKQLIQRLVTSNPSPSYVRRVAAVFNDDGSKVKGNLKAVIAAILLDPEARQTAGGAQTALGKQREPILRFVAWARAYQVSSLTDAWKIGNTSDPVSRLGQSPLRSPSVFNFFRPGYVPPNSGLANAGLVAPEFQLTNESTIVGYLNFMQNAVRGTDDMLPNYAGLLALADNAAALVEELNTVLAAGQLSAETQGLIANAVATMRTDTDARRLNRVYAALVLVLASPEFIIQR